MPYGQNAGLALAFQNSFGTAAAVGSLHHLPTLNTNIGLSQDELISQNLNGRFDESDAASGRRRYGGQWEGEAQPQALGALITSVINDPTHVDSGAGLATYTWKPRTSDFDSNVAHRPVSFYKWLVEADSAAYFYDLVGTRLEFTISEGGFLLARTAYVGGKFSAVASQSLTAENTRRWPWNTTSLSLGGSANANFRNLTIVHDEALEELFTLDGTLTTNRVKRRNPRTIRVNGTLVFENPTEFDNFMNETTQAFVLTLQNTAVAIQSGYYNTLKIDIPQFKWLQFNPPVSGPGPVEVSFTGKGEYKATSATMVQYTLQNSWQTGYEA